MWPLRHFGRFTRLIVFFSFSSGRKSIGKFKMIIPNCIYAFYDDRLCFGLLMGTRLEK